MRILAAVVAVLALAPVAPAAATPGWKQLITDWYDGRIDGVYRCSTYRAALRRVPQDGQTTARRDLERRLRERRCVASRVPRTGKWLGPKPEDGGRNYVADGVAAILAVVAVILLVRRRRQLRR